MGVNQQHGYAQVVGSPASRVNGASSEWWYNPPPALYANSRNEEFDSDQLNPLFQWWTDPTVGSALTLSSAVNNVDLTPDSLPGTIPRYKINNQRRPSWLEYQVPKSAVTSNVVFAAGSWWLLKPLVPNADDTYITRIQAPNLWVTGGGPSSGVSHFLCIMAATAGVPDKNNAILLGSQGIGTSTGSSFSNMYTVLAGVVAQRPLGSFDGSVGVIAGLILRRRASSNWLGIFQDPASVFTRSVAEFAQAFTPAFIGWWTRIDNGVTYNPVNAIDLLRCPASKDAVPL